MDLNTLLVLAVIVATIATPAALFISLRFGLVGGTPRELVAVQLEVERRKAEVEEQRSKAMAQEVALREERMKLEMELKRDAFKAQQQRHNTPGAFINPQAGLRG